MNPAKIFMGDTGSTFLGFILAVVSIQGLFKFYTIISFAVPFLMLGLPLFDTCFAILRRLSKGKAPCAGSRHVHHRLIDMALARSRQWPSCMWSVPFWACPLWCSPPAVP